MNPDLWNFRSPSYIQPVTSQIGLESIRVSSSTAATPIPLLHLLSSRVLFSMAKPLEQEFPLLSKTLGDTNLVSRGP